MKQIENMTMDELSIRKKAYDLRLVDLEEVLINQSFLDRSVNATNKDGVYLFKEPSEIINFKKIRNKITGDNARTVNKFKEMSERAARARQEAIENLRRKEGK